MNRTVRRWSALAMLFWFSGIATAATTSASCTAAFFSAVIPSTPTITCPQFQAGGTLQSVQITVFGQMQDAGHIQNTAPFPYSFLFEEIAGTNFGPLPGFSLSGYNANNPALIIWGKQVVAGLGTSATVPISLVPEPFTPVSLGAATTSLGGYVGAGTFMIPVTLAIAQTRISGLNAPVAIPLLAVTSNQEPHASAVVTFTSDLSPYNVSYDPNGSEYGSVPVDGATYAAGAQVTVLGSAGQLTRTGYTLGRWNTAPDGQGISYAFGATFSIGAADVRLYAMWDRNTCSLDLDGNGSVDALTDGLMILRAMFGLTGTAVTNGAIGGGKPIRTSWAQIQPYLNGNCGTGFVP
jgi:hypothetical protein